MLIDLHAHYPMRVIDDLTPATAVKELRKVRHRPYLRDKFRALVVRFLAVFINMEHWWSDYRITVDGLRAGHVGVAFSVLYRPFEELDLSKRYAAAPESGYFPQLVGDLEDVEAEVGGYPEGTIRIAHDRAELDAGLAAGETTLVHCVEGGFHLGDTETEIAANVADLAHRGVAYITLAHLFYRQVATNAPAIPFLPDPLYRRVFPQPKNTGLTDRGVAAVRAMVEHGVLVDVSHMDEDAFSETMRLLDQIDGDAKVPVISSHAGYRFGKQVYMHSEEQVRAIARRDGVIGLIFAQHQLCEGLRKHTSKLEESYAVLQRHIDEIHRITGSHRHVAIGTDFDGFIKPTLGGFEKSADLEPLEDRLRRDYGDDTQLLCSENALRALRAVWT